MNLSLYKPLKRIANKILCYLLLTISIFTYGQQTVKGVVKNKDSGQPLENITVSLKRSNVHTHTLHDGSFTIKTEYLPDSLLISGKGYEEAEYRVDEENLNFTILLDHASTELDQVIITSKRLTSEIMSVDLKMNPVNSAQDLLRKVPGLFIAQHAGGGKAEQIFLRGFDADHGTDVAISVDGLPVNMVSHAHGQGYSDLHFVIPETVKDIDFGKGAYYADKGDFDTGGYVNLETYNKIDNNMVKVEGGMFNSLRAVGLFNLINEENDNTRRHMYAAGEFNYTDGPFDYPQNFSRVNLFARYNEWINEKTYINFQASTFTSKWNASGQNPERAINEGIISRWGSLDPTEGGNTSRTNLLLNYKHYFNENEEWQSMIYYSHYDFNLFSNFTFYLNDPVYGDEIQQKENRNIYGMDNKYIRNYHFASGSLIWKSGFGFRYDDITNTELNHVYHQNLFLGRESLAAITQTNLYAYTSAEWKKGKWLINPGLRLDYLIFNLDDKLNTDMPAQGETAARLSPKLNIFYNASNIYQLYIKSGMGFHSNDARVVIQEKGHDILPYSLGGDLGAVIKPARGLLIQPALWYLYLQQEFVYVGDEAVVEPSGQTQRYGFDLSVRYQPLKWLYLDVEINYAHARYIDEPKGQNYVPLAPQFTSTGGIAVKLNSGFSANLRYRYMQERPANEDNTAKAKGYFVNDLFLAYTLKKWELSIQIQNIFDVEWNEAQFYTETRLQNEAAPISDICFTPGNPFFLKAGVKISF